jgi:hypothetical protein
MNALLLIGSKRADFLPGVSPHKNLTEQNHFPLPTTAPTYYGNFIRNISKPYKKASQETAVCQSIEH